MSDWSRRDVLKSAIALPAASALRSATPSGAGPPARKSLRLARAAGQAGAAAARLRLAIPLRPRQRPHQGLRLRRRPIRRVPEDRRTSCRRAAWRSTTATGRRSICRTTGPSACRSRTTRRWRARAPTRSDATTPRRAWAGTGACSSCRPPTRAGASRIEFDGAYRDTMVVFNGYYIGRHGGGYDPFSFDVTDFANPGDAQRAARPRGRHAERRLVLRGRRHLPARLAREDRAGPREEVGHVRPRQRAARARPIVSIRTEVENHDEGRAERARRSRRVLDPSGKEVGKAASAPAQSIPNGARADLRAAGGGHAAGAVVARAAEPLHARDRGRVRRRRSPTATRRRFGIRTCASTPSRASS